MLHQGSSVEFGGAVTCCGASVSGGINAAELRGVKSTTVESLNMLTVPPLG